MDFSQLAPEHKTPGKMGGGKDNSRKNIFPAHFYCNAFKGSRRDVENVKKELQAKRASEVHLF